MNDTSKATEPNTYP